MKKSCLFLILLLFLSFGVFSQEKKAQINWEAGFKGCIDTANIKLEEDPFFAFGTYLCGGQAILFNKNNTLLRWDAGLGFSSYAGYMGFATAAVSYGYNFYQSESKDFSLSVLGTVDFQMYCYKTPFFGLGCDLYAKHYVYENIGFYADLGLFFNYAFISFMPKMEFGVSFR